jgi:hypothetical protein
VLPDQLCEPATLGAQKADADEEGERVRDQSEDDPVLTQDKSRLIIMPIAARKRSKEDGMKTRLPTTSVSFAKSAWRLPSRVARMRNA